VAVLVTGGARSGKSRFAETYAIRLASRGIYVATAQPLDDEMAQRVRAHREQRRRSGFAWETIEEPLDLAGLLDRLAAGQPESESGSRNIRQPSSGALMEQQPSSDARTDLKPPAGTRSARQPVSAGRANHPADPGTQTAHPVVLVDCLTLWLTNQLLAVSPDGGANSARVEREMDERVEQLADAVRLFPHPLVLVTNEVGYGIVPETALGRQFRDAAGRMNQRLAGICDQMFLVVSGIPVELKHIAFRMDDFAGLPTE
jgi:adenosylcobinamide kinase/adenosylcobinamide-phosphate guanylyltransferase